MRENEREREKGEREKESENERERKRLKREWGMGWLRLAGSIKLWVSFAKEPYKRDDIVQERPVI
jgi:hypothetical protein